ncbi:MAG: hypothetical protein JXR07_14750 [Reichenbachiella sp.]
MDFRFTTKVCTAFIIILFTFFSKVIAQDDDFDVDIEEETTDYNWQTPAGKYLEPSSFFSLHGYVNGVYGTSSTDWTAPDPTQLQAPGQLLVPNTPNSSFQFDFALIFGSELTERLRLALEAHYVSNPSGNGTAGPGGITIAITEATGSFDLVPKYLTISGGIYWSPFGILSNDWLGAQNNFSLLPRASGVYPVHFNERGIRLNGAVDFGNGFGMNYVASYGNGLSNWNITGQSSYDNNDAKTITGRLGFFPGLGEKLELGVSYMNGVLREEGDPNDMLLTSPLHYGAGSNAFGVDAVFNSKIIEFRGYLVMSAETLESDGINDPGDLKRMGYMGEVLFNIILDRDHFSCIQPKIRYDYVQVDQLVLSETNTVGLNNYSSVTYSAGVNLEITDNFRFSFDYNIINELDYYDLDNDRFIAKIIAQF